MIETPRHLETRPTHARLRQALFNSIQCHIAEARVLDLFAGSGALGFEALSRGAARVVSVEEARATAKLIEKNVATLQVESRSEILARSVGDYLKRPVGGPFEIIFAD